MDFSLSSVEKKKKIIAFWSLFSVSPSLIRLQEIFGISFVKKDFPLCTQKNISLEYLKKGIYWSSLLRYIPFVRGIAIVNTVAMGVANRESDIDLLILTEKNRIWTVRFLVTLFFMITRLRKTEKKSSGRFCLSFFIDTQVFDFSQIKKEKDPYLGFWIISALPVFGDIWDDFFLVNEKWISKELGFYTSPTKALYPLSGIQKGGEKILPSFIELMIKKIWKPRTLRKKTQLSDPSGTIIDDHILKFHDYDKRDFFQKKFEEALRS